MRISLGCACLVALALVGACEAHNPANCSDGVCTDLSRPFCDVDGTLGGHPMTCIAVSCTPGEFKACRDNGALTCNAAGTSYDVTQCERGCSDASGGCVTCANDNECEAPTPFCSGTGVCVECLRDSQCGTPAKPVCDLPSHSCRGCATDDECPSSACDFVTGSCVDEAAVIYASPTGGNVANCGSRAVQCQLSAAFGKLTATRTTIKLATGSYAITSTISLASKTAIVHGDGATVSPSGTLNPMFEVGDGAQLSVYGLGITQPNITSGSAAIDCSSTTTPPPSLTLTRTSIATGAIGVHSNHCSLQITSDTFTGTNSASFDPLLFLLTSDAVVSRSTIANAPGIDVRLASSIHVMNTVFHDNFGFGFSNANIAPSTVTFSTFYNSPIRCADAQQTASTVFSNNIVMSTGTADVASGTECAHRYEILQPELANISSDHILRRDPAFRNPAMQDFHLTPVSPAIDAADPASSASTDFDGVTRPQGAANDLGAFELH